MYIIEIIKNYYRRVLGFIDDNLDNFGPFCLFLFISWLIYGYSDVIGILINILYNFYFEYVMSLFNYLGILYIEKYLLFINIFFLIFLFFFFIIFSHTIVSLIILGLFFLLIWIILRIIWFIVYWASL